MHLVERESPQDDENETGQLNLVTLNPVCIYTLYIAMYSYLIIICDIAMMYNILFIIMYKQDFFLPLIVLERDFVVCIPFICWFHYVLLSCCSTCTNMVMCVFYLYFHPLICAFF